MGMIVVVACGVAAVFHIIVLALALLCVSAGEESAYELKRLLTADDLRAPEDAVGSADFYVSDQPEAFERVASIFLAGNLERGAQKIDIETY